jgi:predicted  nucleic acid-binding Zn-ribbon protein
MSTLSAQLDREKTGSTDLRDVLNNQRHEMEELTSQIEESEEKHCELEKKLQALTRLFDQQR